MNQTTLTKNNFLLFKLVFLFGLFLASKAVSGPVQEPSVKEFPCAVLQAFEGRVQILDPTRTRIIDTDLNAAIPCGGWVSVEEGWAQLKHRQGFQVRLGPESFLEVFDNDKDTHLTNPDHFILFKGKFYAQVKNGMGEMRVISPNARARLTDGSVMFLFSQWDEDSQLIALEKTATLENRFETSRKIKVQAGEASSLNFKALRVVPSFPMTVKVASLKEKLSNLSLENQEQAAAIRAAAHRWNRRFPAPLNAPREPGPNPAGPELQPKRALASTTPVDSSSPKYTYLRHPPNSGDEKAEKQWVKNLVGGEDQGEKILFPEKFVGKPRTAAVKVVDPVEKLRIQKQKEEESEKKRLMNELSKIELH